MEPKDAFIGFLMFNKQSIKEIAYDQEHNYTYYSMLIVLLGSIFSAILFTLLLTDFSKFIDLNLFNLNQVVLRNPDILWIITPIIAFLSFVFIYLWYFWLFLFIGSYQKIEVTKTEILRILGSSMIYAIISIVVFFLSVFLNLDLLGLLSLLMFLVQLGLIIYSYSIIGGLNPIMSSIYILTAIIVVGLILMVSFLAFIQMIILFVI